MDEPLESWRDQHVTTLFYGDEASPEFGRTQFQHDAHLRGAAIRAQALSVEPLLQAAIEYRADPLGKAADRLQAAARDYAENYARTRSLD